ncbi:DUF3843 family protein [uncultured Sphingobacterium sp.]|uniref:DUF3843 family protein n=1 Tax=uncultured Sphingobacterium sp. TaxID=182688 RepID=UPI0025CEA4C7|nr:DUF3843 family protein [uncultured Sphingobacterium sp.]
MRGNRIFIQDWIAHHTYQKTNEIDSYYLRVANEINDSLSTLWFEEKETNDLINTDALKTLSIYLTCYLEDVIAKTGIFAAFRTIHTELYNQLLPFYSDNDLTDYYAEDINSEDIAVLTWLFFSERNPHLFIDPRGRLIQLVTDLAYSILEEHYEVAPENEKLKLEYVLDERANYFEVRNFIEKLVATNYLTAGEYNTNLNHLMQVAEIGRYQHDQNQLQQMIYRVRDNHFNNYRLHLFALKASEFVAEVVGKEHALYRIVKTLGNRINSFFEYVKTDELYVHVKHIGTKTPFKIFKDSIQQFVEPTETLSFYMEIVPWKDAWNLSGIMTVVNPNEVNFDLPEQYEMTYRIEALNGKDKSLKKTEKQLKDMGKLFQAEHKAAVAFMEGKEVKEFATDFFKKYQQKYPSKEESPLPESNLDLTEDAKVTVFFNPKTGLEVFGGIEEFFPLDNNNFVEKDNQNEVPFARYFLNLLVEDFFPSELPKYYINLFKAEVDKQFFFPVDNEVLDFFLRFYKRGTYYLGPFPLLK